MDEVFVPEAMMLGRRESPQRPLQLPRNKARYGIAWSPGYGRGCWHAARQYTLDREAVRPPLAQNQLIQKKLADMQTEIALGLQGCLQAGPAAGRRTAQPEMVSLIKRNSCGKALDVARMACDMHSQRHPRQFHVIRHMMNLRPSPFLRRHPRHPCLILGRAQTGCRPSSDPRAAAPGLSVPGCHCGPRWHLVTSGGIQP